MRLTLTVFFFFVLSLSSQELLAERLRLNGTGGAIGIMRELAEAFERLNPAIKVEISMPVAGSGGSIRGLMAGKLDIAISARPLKQRERESGLQSRPFARTPFVFVTARKTLQSPDYTLDQLADIYAGHTDRWPSGKRLRLILRPQADSDTFLLQNMSPAMAEAVARAHARKGMVIAMTDQEAASMVETIEGAMGTSLMSLIVSEQRALTALSIDGVEPRLETMLDGRYPYHKTFRLIFPARHSPATASFLRFMRSDLAAGIVSKNSSQALLP